jgi:hypothetical protein
MRPEEGTAEAGPGAPVHPDGELDVVGDTGNTEVPKVRGVRKVLEVPRVPRVLRVLRVLKVLEVLRREEQRDEAWRGRDNRVAQSACE